MPTEKAEERKYARWVKKQGGRCVKLNTVGPFGTTGEPDRLTFLGPPPMMSLKEFKRPGKKPTPLQEEVHKHYRKMGIPVHVVFSAKEAIEIDQRALGVTACKTEKAPTRKHQVWIAASGSRIFPRTGAGQDTHNVVYIQDTAQARRGGPSRSDRRKKNNLRRLAAGG